MTHCGHPETGFLTSAEGTSYCPVCEQAASLIPDRIAELELDKALDFMADEELREEARAEIEETREAADAIAALLAEGAPDD